MSLIVFTGGKILGVSEGLRVVHSVDRTQRGLELAPLGKTYVSFVDVSKSVSDKCQIPRYSARPLEAASDRHRRRLLIRPDDEDTSFDPRSSFVAFDIRPRRPLDTSETPTYRNISRVDEKDDDEEADVLDTALSRFWTLEEDLRRRTTEMARHLQQHPDDVETWITYSTIHLKLSPELASGQNAGVINPAKPPQTRANAEVTLSILARALDAHEQNTASPRLHIAYVHAAETIWPPEKVTERWKNVLRELSGRRGRQVEEGIMAVWLGYIEWREGQGFGKSADGREGLGGVEEVVDVYVGCLASLGNSKRSGKCDSLWSPLHFSCCNCRRPASSRRESGVPALESLPILETSR